jgi:NAD+ kinase
MNASVTSFNRIAVASHPSLPQASELGIEIAKYLEEQGRSEIHASLYDPTLRGHVQAKDVDLLIALGGDGTMLRAGNLCAPVGVPILAGEFWLEQRMMLRTEHFRDGKRLGSWNVVNECFVGRGETVRPVHLVTEIDDHYLTTYVADGLIVATPTGSTAYALAAGGPILPPQLRNILIVPVAPHLSVERAIVLHEGSWVRVTIRSDH